MNRITLPSHPTVKYRVTITNVYEGAPYAPSVVWLRFERVWENSNEWGLTWGDRGKVVCVGIEDRGLKARLEVRMY